MEIMIDNRQDKIIYDKDVEKLIVQAIKLCLAEEKLSTNLEVSISFVDNTEIHWLNKEYRGMDKATDVLSFPQYENIHEEVEPNCLGDIVISLEKAMEQCLEYGHSFEREVIFLTVHSMFHLMGYDHDTPENTLVMRKKEEGIMEAMGIIRS